VLEQRKQLIEEPVIEARTNDYEGTPVGPEHLVALALQSGGARRRERAWHLLQFGGVDRARLQVILKAHGIPADIPDDV
jgi:hypothetical protein